MDNSKSDHRSPWEGLEEKRRTPEEEKSFFSWIPPWLSGRLILVYVFLAVLIGAAFYFYYKKPQGPNVGIQFIKPDQILLGDQFTLTVSFSNYSDAVLKNAKLALFLPEDVSFIGQSPDQRVTEQAIGDLGPGSITPQNFNLIVTGGGNALKRMGAKLSYSTQNSNAQFETLGDIDLIVGQPAVSLNMSLPQNVFNGQDFDIKLDYANNTSHEFKNFHLKISYPPIFNFKRSSVQAESTAGNSWNLGTLAGGSKGTIIVTGNIIGAEKALSNFRAVLTSELLGGTYSLNNQSADISIAAAPLALDIKLNDAPDYVASLGESLTYTLTYTNNSDVAMQDINVSAVLIGDMFDFTTLQTNGAFSSITNAVSWFVANTPQLASLAPGQSGSVDLHIKLKDAYPIRLLSDKNFSLKILAQIQSPTVPANTAAKKTISVANLENKVSGKIDLASEAYWRDADSGILNSGPYPPKVNQPTQYTIHWRITNYSTDVANIKISAYLQSGSRFTGQVKSNIDSVPTYNSNTGQVVWQINFLPATKGVINQAAEAIFQIENTPAVNQIGQNVILIGETKLEGTDSFVNKLLTSSAQQLDTDLPHDKTISQGFDKRVQP